MRRTLSSAGLLFLVVATFFPSFSPAQEVYRASWTVQERTIGLEQDLAERIIGLANDWLTRDDPNAPVARLDDGLRITVVGLYDAASGEVREELRQVNLGGIVLDENLTDVFGVRLIDTLVRRDYFWRDPSITVIDPSLLPNPMPERIAPRDRYVPRYADLFENRPEPHLASTDRLRPLRFWLDVGHEELGLNGLSYGRARVGTLFGSISPWIEIPLPVGDGESFPRRNSASWGFGFTFEEGFAGGGFTWSEPESAVDVDGDTGSMMAKSALLYGIIPIAYMPAIDGWVRVKAGAGYLQESMIVDLPEGLRQRSTEDHIRPFVRIEARREQGNALGLRSLGLELFGGSLVGSGVMMINSWFAVRIGAGYHGLGGDPIPFYPDVTFEVTPLFTF